MLKICSTLGRWIGVSGVRYLSDQRLLVRSWVWLQILHMFIAFCWIIDEMKSSFIGDDVTFNNIFGVLRPYNNTLSLLSPWYTIRLTVDLTRAVTSLYGVTFFLIPGTLNDINQCIKVCSNTKKSDIPWPVRAMSAITLIIAFLLNIIPFYFFMKRNPGSVFLNGIFGFIGIVKLTPNVILSNYFLVLCYMLKNEMDFLSQRALSIASYAEKRLFICLATDPEAKLAKGMRMHHLAILDIVFNLSVRFRTAIFLSLILNSFESLTKLYKAVNFFVPGGVYNEILNDDPNNSYRILTNCFLGSLCIFNIFIFNHGAQQLFKKTEDLDFTLHKVQLQNRLSPVSYREIGLLRKQCIAIDNKIEVYGMFNLGYPLFAQLVMMMTQYLIILKQFNVEEIAFFKGRDWEYMLSLVKRRLNMTRSNSTITESFYATTDIYNISSFINSLEITSNMFSMQSEPVYVTPTMYNISN